MTQIVEQADATPSLKSGTYSGIVTWKACSNIAHSNASAAIGMFERRQIDPGDGRGAQYWVTSSVSVIAFMFEVAVNFLEALVSETVASNSVT